MTSITYETAASATINTTTNSAGKVGTGKPRRPKTPSLLRRIYEGVLEGRRLHAEMMKKHRLLTWY